MKRILMVLAAALVLAAVLVVMSAPGFANPCPNDSNPNCVNPGGQDAGNVKVFTKGH